MGQRLNIEIKNKGKVLANSYYHWSRFSKSALKLTKKIIDNFDEIQEDNEIIRAVRLLGLTGEGLTRNAIDYAYKNIKGFDLTLDDGKGFLSKCLIPITKGRNEGLIDISDEEMEDTRCWEEGRITVNIDSKTFDFNVLFKMSLKKFIEEYEDVKIENLKEVPFDFENIPFNKIDELIEFVKTTQEVNDGNFKINNDEIGILIY